MCKEVAVDNARQTTIEWIRIHNLQALDYIPPPWVITLTTKSRLNDESEL